MIDSLSLQTRYTLKRTVAFALLVISIQFTAPLVTQAATSSKNNKEISNAQRPSELPLKAEPLIYLDTNGITIRCDGATVGYKETLGTVEYEVVDRALLIVRRDEGADLTRVCTSLVTDMSNLFSEKDFNQPIGNWDVSSATDMNYMFHDNTVFNQSLKFWCVTKISTPPVYFSTSSLLPGNMPVWGTCPTPIITDIPTITSVTPGVGSQGRTLNLTVNGSGFLADYTTLSLGPDIQINSFTVTNSTIATANVTISATASLGARNVSVTNPAPGGGSATLSNGFEVIEPAVLSVTPVSISKTAAGGTETIVISNTAEVGSLNWTAIANDSWVTLSASSGTDDASIVATIAENLTFSARSSTIVISSDGAINSPTTITVTQARRLQAPVVTTTAATNLGGASAVVGGNVTSQGSSQVTSRGVCYSVTPSPTIASSCVDASESGIGEFTVTLSGLNGLSLYYARAFATNTEGVSYGQEINFTTLNPVPKLTSLSIASGTKGQTMGLTLTGSGFMTGITSVVFGEGIQIQSFSVVNATTASVSIVIDNTAQAGTRDITVTNIGPGGGSSTLTNGFTITSPPTLSVTPVSFSKSSAGGFENINLSNSGGGILQWTAVSDQNWLTLSATSGVGNGPVVATLSENTNFTSRNATIVISALGALNSPITVTVTQDANVQAPVVTTEAATSITTNSVVLGGIVQSQGSATVTRRGVCFDITDAPTIESSCVTSPATGTGLFTVNVTGLTQATRYYARAFAENSEGLSYGGIISFNTWLPVPTLTALSQTSSDQGQSLSVVLTGSGFLAGSTTVSFGEGIQVSSFTVNSATTATAAIVISASATSGKRGVSVFNPAPGGGTATLSNSFTVTRPLSLVVDPLSITKLAAGGSEIISISNGGDGTLVWSAGTNQSWITLSAGTGTGNTTITATIATNSAISQRLATITISATGTSLPAKVINVTQSGTQLAPSVTTTAAANVTASSAVLGGTVTSEGSQTVTARGVCFSTTESPTISDTCINGVTPGLGDFTVSASVLNPNTLYFARAFAQNAVGISYGQTITFLTLKPEPKLTTLAPNTGSVGQGLTVVITGTGFLNGITTISFGDSIQVASFSVASPSSGTASIVISPKAIPGSRNISVTNSAPGGGTTTLNAGFTVTALPVIEVTPATITAVSTASTQSIQIRNTGGGTMPWTALSNQSWLRLSAASGTGTATLTATIADNPTFVTRTASITITANGAINSPRIVSVSQAGKSPAPVITTASAVNITTNSVQLGGTVTSQGASTVVERGVCFATTPTPTFSDTCVKATNAGVGAFNMTINNINSSTLFNARAYATNSDATTFGQTIQFTTLSAGNPRPFVTSLSPILGAKGSFVDVNILGGNFAASGLSIQAGEGITVSNITRLSIGSINARFTISAAAPVGSRLITVTNPAPGGGTSNNVVQFFVTLPAPIANSANWSATTMNQKSQKPQFDWARVTDADNYTVQYSNRSVFPQLTSCSEECTEANTDIFTNTHKVNGIVFTVPTFLEANTTHYWRVRANTETVEGVWSPIYSFMTIPAPTPPALLAPSNGASGLTGTVPLRWAATTNTTRYQLEVSPNIYFTPTVVAVDNLTTPSFTMPAFTSTSPAEFFWRVRSFGLGGNSSWSSVNTYRRAALTSDGGDQSELPADFELLQNYPNPFNPSTNIAFSLPTAAHVTLTVHSILGQEVAVLVNKTMVGGRHVVTFDASKLSSGVYLYRLTAGEFTQTRVMNLVK